MLKCVILRTCAAVITAAMLLTVGVGKGGSYDVKDPQTCLLNFSVLSDSHVEGNNVMRYRVFARALQDVKRNKSGNDAVVFLGDNTMNGQHIENLLFHGAVHALLRGGTILPVVGNHDIGNADGEDENRYRKLQNRWFDYTAAFFGRKLSTPYYREIIDGYSFIVLGPEMQRVYEMAMSDTQFAFLEDALAEAAESGRPAFVFLHFPTDSTTDLDLQSTGRLTKMLAAYHREHDLFCFVGHTHMPLHLYWSFHTGDGFPQTYLPRLTELGGEKDDEPGTETGVGMEVEVYADEVVLRGRDFYNGEWLVDAWEDDDVLCEKTYALKS